MPKYRIFRGSFKALMDGIKYGTMDDIKYGALYYQPGDKAAYQNQLEQDIHRNRCLSFNQPIIDFQSRLYSPDHYESAQFYNQGDLNGQFIENFDQMVYQQQASTISCRKTLCFAYLNDNEIPCAFAIMRYRVPDEPENDKYLIWHIHNSTGSAELREIIMISEEELTKKLSAEKLFENTVNEKDIFTTLKNRIGSDKVYEFLSSLLDNNQLCIEKLNLLLNRLSSNTNLDNRDIRQKILNELLDSIEPTSRKKVRLKVEISDAASRDINFFETSQFEDMLFKKNLDVSIEPKRLYSIQLRYLVSEELRNNQQTVENIYKRLIGLKPTILSSITEQQVKKDIQRAYDAGKFENALYKLDQYIHECRQPYRRAEADNLLQYCKNKVAFDKLNVRGQEQLIALVEKWSTFKHFSYDTEYQSIEALYKKFGIRTPNRDHILQTPEQARITWALQQQFDAFTFDPQGHIIYDTVDAEGYRVTVSKDTCDSHELNKAYLNEVRLALINAGATQTKTKQILNLLKKKNFPSATIRPLQQELHIFLSQIAHQCQQKYLDPNFNETDCQQALNKTMQVTSKLVMAEFAKALMKASDGDNIDIAAVNKNLNVAWDVIVAEAKTSLYAQIATHLGQTPPQQATATNSHGPLYRGASTPLIYTDHRLGLANWIDSRHPNPEFTHRGLQSYVFNPKNTTITGERNRTLAMIPTIPHVQDFNQYQQTINERLTYISLFYSFKETFTYHLFPESTEITHKNLQQTLLTLHGFNRSRIRAFKADIIQPSQLKLGFCDTLSMMPTQRPLGYRSYEFSALGNEATLMTEMALIQQLAPENLDTQGYKEFLVPAYTYFHRYAGWLFHSSFFSRTKEGKQTQATIKNIKLTWRGHIVTGIPDNEELLTLCLKRIMAYDLHFGPEFNELTQALTLAQSKQSLVAHSSKSRAAYYLGLTQLFDQNPIPQELLKALQELANVSEDYQYAKIMAQTLQNCLKKLYANNNTYGAAMQATKAVTEAAIPETREDMLRQAKPHGSYSRVIESMPAPGQQHSTGEKPRVSNAVTLPPPARTSRKIDFTKKEVLKRLNERHANHPPGTDKPTKPGSL